MRTRFAMLAGLLVVLAAPASASAAQSVSCAAPSATVLFWPTGHAAVPSVDFPKIKTPHIEIYKPGARFPSSNFLLYADANRGIDPSVSCGSGAVGKTVKVANAKTIKQTKAVTCKASAGLAYDIKRSKHGLTIIGHAGPRAYFSVEVRAKGSALTYDRKACKATAAPKR